MSDLMFAIRHYYRSSSASKQYSVMSISSINHSGRQVRHESFLQTASGTLGQVAPGQGSLKHKTAGPSPVHWICSNLTGGFALIRNITVKNTIKTFIFRQILQAQNNNCYLI
uniref:Uncharacterized protein n=1 Tax=Arion vulgaris TaxID=1028688 RepID=A0A0B6Z5E9_9EUPU